jgi:hypothetical protein
MIYVITSCVKCALSQRSSSNLKTFCYLAAYIWTAHDGHRDALFPSKADQIRSTSYWKASGQSRRPQKRRRNESCSRYKMCLELLGCTGWCVPWISSVVKRRSRYNEKTRHRRFPPPPQLRNPTDKVTPSSHPGLQPAHNSPKDIAVWCSSPYNDVSSKPEIRNSLI